MDRRFVLFVVLSIGILVGFNLLMSKINPPPPKKPVAKQGAGKDAKNGLAQPPDKAAPDKTGDKPPSADQPSDQPPAAVPPEVDELAAVQPQWFTLGSVDSSKDNPYRMLVTLTNRGAAVERIELSSPRFRDADDRSGYLGNLALQETAAGLQVNVVGAGTPAAAAGVVKDDVITQLNGQPCVTLPQWSAILDSSRPEQSVQISLLRSGEPQTVTASLIRRPLEIIRPESIVADRNTVVELPPGQQPDPLSFLFTLWQVDNERLPDPANPKDEKLDAELAGVRLRTAPWGGKQIDADSVEFTRPISSMGLEVVKRYRIAKDVGDGPAYHLELDVEIRLAADATTPRKVAYQLDGPTGLPIEGWWYASRISRTWSAVGVRDTAIKLQGGHPQLVSPMKLAGGELDPKFVSEDPNALLAYAGVDAQFFAVALLPKPFLDRGPWLQQIKAILVGKLPVDSSLHTLGNVSCRLISNAVELQPGGQPLAHTYTIFAGPKQPALLEQYGNAETTDNLRELIYYGWPIWGVVARVMTSLLHIFYALVGNYGIAIIMLTVVVRGMMFPLSRKQALGAQKMQELKPEMDKINEKFKGKPEERTRAMQQLWKKHNYNPLSGCLLVFLQLPIFIGLYRALSIDVELRQAPLISEAIRWCSNLAAPDMFWYWRGTMPAFLTAYKGFGSLGPYLNLLPLVTVALFLWQQKMFMPPATDETTQAQQKMMKYMMIFIGFMFFTVPAGLCIYFIASSLWGIAERKFLPKVQHATAGTGGEPTAAASSPVNAAEERRERRKQKGRK